MLAVGVRQYVRGRGGAVAGVTCFSVDLEKGLRALGGLRAIALNQTTPPVGPAGTVSDIVFNPSQTALIAVVKGNGMDTGFIYAYPVEFASADTAGQVTRAEVPLKKGKQKIAVVTID